MEREKKKKKEYYLKNREEIIRNSKERLKDPVEWTRSVRIRLERY